MYDVIGDVHGCYREFVRLTEKLGYQWTQHLPIHPNRRKLVFVGDIADRGPDSLKMIRTVVDLVDHELALYVPGNHCDKLYRYLIGRRVQVAHGLETTVHELEQLDRQSYKEIAEQFQKLYQKAPLILYLDQQRLVVCHAGIRQQDLFKPINKKIKSFALYGDVTGKKDANGLPERRDWAAYYHGEALIAYGHTPVMRPRWKNNTVNLDTGCVFGGQLSALRYPEMELVSVDSTMPRLPERFRFFPD
ncbi:bis(5'-nucleosyl)-tetraphosphatase PrpE [Sporolactobacillus inulinus]|jgi:protein phosphatase|uniref:Bis(5'-nucleosyl)-tetraphosphatase n=1 Tax=Sporolactobacillus inulinus CASD TaxID=1069536 RepID=A0A0U1QSK1_9BACL|nr:bis(5'-nucleosyl)-tetraphosphatase PrpE [Sporolactobacillus inulinus]KLI03788.1 bis(5'-nucleosyl)-tetraphosphatase [Sporolactobacillus inulinus CASD]GEB76534.1 bis(5'-nucleosyl)-tetraphosphatase PrpE [asymmetrical] [Sporolactobacillus inulinus]